MKFPLSWLKRYLETTATADDLAAAMTRLGLEVEGVENPADALKPFVIAKVLTAERHPQADKLQVLSVDTGAGTFWLRAMFSLAVRPDGPAGAAMRDAMAQMIAAEDPAAPLDDAGLARALAGAGAPIARRTVAKYRMELGIPTAAGRKRAAKLSSATRKPG